MSNTIFGIRIPEVVHSLCIEINVNHYILRCFEYIKNPLVMYYTVH